MLTKLTTNQNNTLTFTIHFSSGGTDTNITGATVLVTVYNGDTVVQTATVTSHTTPLEGLTTVSFTKEQTSTWAATLLGYEVQLTLSAGGRYTDNGLIEVIKDR